jgi:hypothetical protein
MASRRWRWRIRCVLLLPLPAKGLFLVQDKAREATWPKVGMIGVTLQHTAGIRAAVEADVYGQQVYMVGAADSYTSYNDADICLHRRILALAHRISISLSTAAPQSDKVAMPARKTFQALAGGCRGAMILLPRVMRSEDLKRPQAHAAYLTVPCWEEGTDFV